MARALEADLDKLADTRATIDRAIEEQIAKIAHGKDEVSAALAAEVAKVEDAFRLQIGQIEDRTRGVERALTTGVENVRTALERSAGAVAGALRDRVVEITALLTEDAGKVFTDADQIGLMSTLVITGAKIWPV